MNFDFVLFCFVLLLEDIEIACSATFHSAPISAYTFCWLLSVYHWQNSQFSRWILVKRNIHVSLDSDDSVRKRNKQLSCDTSAMSIRIFIGESKVADFLEFETVSVEVWYFPNQEILKKTWDYCRKIAAWRYQSIQVCLMTTLGKVGASCNRFDFCTILKKTSKNQMQSRVPLMINLLLSF